MAWKNAVKFVRGMTILETVIVLMIVAVLASVMIITLSGMRAKDNVDRGAQSIQDDLLFIRSRAVSTSAMHRLNFTSTIEWKIEMYSAGPPETWTQVGDIRRMPQDTYLTQDTFTNAGVNLRATSRGLFDFLPGATGDPYVTVTGLGATQNKSLNVDVGGAIEVKNE
jgi:type II secretory pathway pseudopilin PulG